MQVDIGGNVRLLIRCADTVNADRVVEVWQQTHVKRAHAAYDAESFVKTIRVVA